MSEAKVDLGTCGVWRCWRPATVAQAMAEEHPLGGSLFYEFRYCDAHKYMLQDIERPNGETDPRAESEGK